MTDIVNIADYRKKKQEEEQLTRGRDPIRTRGDSFPDQAARVSASLDRIKVLMAALKEMSKNDNNK